MLATGQFLIQAPIFRRTLDKVGNRGIFGTEWKA